MSRVIEYLTRKEVFLAYEILAREEFFLYVIKGKVVIEYICIKS